MFDKNYAIFTLRKPHRREVEEFIAAETSKPFTYKEVGATHPDSLIPPADIKRHYRLLHHRLRLGSGAKVYELARQAVTHWQMFQMDWVQLCWPEAAIAEGTTVAILGQAMGIWSVNGCRIVYVLDQHNEARERFGFAYGTTPGHAIVGEERMMVEWHHKDDSVWYDIHSFSKKSHLLAKMGSFHLHHLQQRFATDSHHAMLRAVEKAA